MRLNLPCALLLALATLLSTGCQSGSGGNAASPPPAAATLPLLAGRSLVGVVYSHADPAAKPTLDGKFASCIAAGADTYELSVTWGSLETTPGVVDVTSLRDLLTTIQGSGLRPYLLLKTIDTATLTLPADLVDSAHPGQLASGLTFAHPTVINRFAAVLAQVVPLLISKGGFALSVANEVDPWLAAHPDERTPFLSFLAAARTQVQASDSRLAVGATCTADVRTTDPDLLSGILARSDVACFTYYPLAADLQVRDPSVVTTDLAQLVTTAGSRYVLLQEAGYPSGYVPGPGNGSSLQKQADFVTAVFTALHAQPRIRFCSFMHLADYTADDVAGFAAYYGDSDPRFVEYLATLGLCTSSGNEKPAFAALLAGLGGVMAIPPVAQ